MLLRFFSGFFSFQEDINKVNWLIYWVIHDFDTMFLSLHVKPILIKKNKNFQFEKLKDILSNNLESIGRTMYSAVLFLGGFQGIRSSESYYRPMFYAKPAEGVGIKFQTFEKLSLSTAKRTRI